MDLGLRGSVIIALSMPHMLHGHSDNPLWGVTLHQISLRAVTIYARKKMIKLQREIDESTIMVGDFNSPLSEEDRSSM